MIAWLARTVVAAELLAGLAAAIWLADSAGWPVWLAAAGGLAVPVLLHAWAIGVQSLTGAWHRRRSGLTKALAPALRAWLCETRASLRSFGLLMPWFGDSPLPSGSDPKRVPVVLVHGYFCNRAVWRPMAAWLAARGHALESENLEPPFAAVEDYLPALDRAVERLRARTGATRVALVGHSMGGLVIRAWLRRHGADRVAAVVTLGSPHQGTWSARFGVGHNVAQMRPDSPLLQGLARSETPAIRRLFTVILSLHDNIVMPQAAQTLDGATHVILEGLGHVELAQNPLVRRHVAEALDRATEARASEARTSEAGASDAEATGARVGEAR